MSERRVEIHFLDPASDSLAGTWRDLAEIKKLRPAEAKAIGYVVDESTDHITLVAHISEGEGDGEICIPKGCIVRTVDLEERHD